MRHGLIAVGTVLALSLGLGCGMAPKRGPELSDDQLYSADAHQWTDADARTALWFTRNFPDDLASFGFAVAKFGSYNKHDNRYGRRHRILAASDAGEKYGVIFHNSPDDYFALIDDPQLRVKMLSLEARERNRMRERDRRRRGGIWPYDASSDPQADRAPDQMEDAEVERRLMGVYQ